MTGNASESGPISQRSEAILSPNDHTVAVDDRRAQSGFWKRRCRSNRRARRDDRIEFCSKGVFGGVADERGGIGGGVHVR
jgi:hypothetical protein